MRRTAVLIACLSTVSGRVGLSQQTVGLVAGGVGLVRTSAGDVSNAATLSGLVRHFNPATALDGQAAISALPHGEWNAQLYLDAWRRIGGGASGSALALTGSLAGSAFPGDALAGSGQALVEWLYQRATYGIALSAGPVIGSIRGTSPQYALRVRGRAWRQSSSWRFTASLEPTYLDSAWYADAALGAAYESGPFSATVSTIGRLTTAEHRATAAAFTAYQFSPRVSLEGGYGGYLPDRFLGFAAATSGSLGARIALGAQPGLGPGPLVAERRGGEVVVRVRVRGAQQVALAGEWADWKPVTLRRIKPNGDLWEGTLTLAPGTYRFNIIVDGARWTLPDGVTSVPDGFGGHAGVLVVPGPAR